MGVMTGLSGNEMYCLRLKGFTPGGLVIGNSVHSMGFLGSIGAGLRNALGGEVRRLPTSFTKAGCNRTIAWLKKRPS